MPYCSVNGIRIYYEASGEGSPLLLIHANPFDHRLWLYQIVCIPMKSASIPKQSGTCSEQNGSPRSRSEATLGICS